MSVDLLHPAVHAGAFDAFLPDAVAASAAQRAWSPQDGALPALFISHGAPPLFNDPEWMRRLHDWVLEFPKPTAILIVSAHWEDAPLSISSSRGRTPIVYDFGGFDHRYYEMTYDTPDADELGADLAKLFSDTVFAEHQRGLDHGAWVPLKVMYPLGDVPVLQLSMPTEDPERLLAIGRRLRGLREQGVLVIGSGHMTHGLPFITRDMWAGNAIPGWSSEFDAWVVEALDRRDLDELLHFRERGPGMPYAHPTVDHFVPMFITLGAADLETAPAITKVDGYLAGISRRSFQIA